MDLFFDLETIPSRREEVCAYLGSSVKMPGTIKKQESIDAWHKNDKKDAQDDAVRATSLDGTFGTICVVGWAFDDSAPQCAYSEIDEAFLLNEFNGAIERELTSQKGRDDPYQVRVVGHNVTGFDLRFLMQRCIVNGIKPHAALTRAMGAKPWEGHIVFDTMVQWSGVGGKNKKLEALCMALGIHSPKEECNGSLVWQWVEDGRIKEVAQYCKRDVAATREVFKRMVYQT